MSVTSRVVLAARLLLLHHTQLRGWLRAWAKRVKTSQFAEIKKKRDLLLSGVFHLALKPDAGDKVQQVSAPGSSEQAPAALIHPCCHSVQETNPEHGVGRAKHSSKHSFFPQTATTCTSCARTPRACR